MANELNMIMGMMMALMMYAVMQPLLVQAQPAAPTFCCPLCVDTCFYTYDELYSHFTTAHPAEPIDIIWE